MLDLQNNIKSSQVYGPQPCELFFAYVWRDASPGLHPYRILGAFHLLPIREIW